MEPTFTTKSNNNAIELNNTEEYNLTGQVLDLLYRDYQFESYKFQDHYKLIWSLNSGPVELIKLFVNPTCLF
jgi:hypothetical protein